MEKPDNYLLMSGAVRTLYAQDLKDFVSSGTIDLTDLILVVCKRVGTQAVPQRVLTANDRLSLLERRQLSSGSEKQVGFMVNMSTARPFRFDSRFRLGDHVSEIAATVDIYFHVLDAEKVVRNLDQDPLRQLCDEMRAELRKFFKRIGRYQDVSERLNEAEAVAGAIGERPALGLALEQVTIDYELPEEVRKSLEGIVGHQLERDLEDQKRLDSEVTLARLEADKRETIRRQQIEVEIELAMLRASQDKIASQRERARLEAETERERARLEAEAARERLEHELEIDTRRKNHQLEMLQREMATIDPNNPASLLLHDPEFRRSYLQMLHAQEMEKIKRLGEMQVKQIEQDKQIELRYAEARLELIRNFLNAKGEILEQEELERLIQMLDEGRSGTMSNRPIISGLIAGSVTRPGTNADSGESIDPMRRDGTETIIEGEWSAADSTS